MKHGTWTRSHTRRPGEAGGGGASAPRGTRALPPGGTRPPPRSNTRDPSVKYAVERLLRTPPTPTFSESRRKVSLCNNQLMIT